MKIVNGLGAVSEGILEGNMCSESVVAKFLSHDKLLEALRSDRFLLLVGKENAIKVRVFRGVDKDYIVSPCRLCTCRDFVIHFRWGRRGYPCYHVIGFYVAESRGMLRQVTVDYQTIEAIVREIALQGFSSTLRRLISRQGF